MSTKPFETDELYDAVRIYKDKEKRKDIINKYGKIEDWDVSKISNFQGIFRYVKFDDYDKDFPSSLSLNNWDMSNAEDISYMFCGSNFNGYIDKWNTENIVLSRYTFNDSAFEGMGDDMKNWNVEKLEETTGMFSNSKFTANISEWKLTSIKFMEKMFYNCHYITGDLNKWNKYIKAEEVSMTEALSGTDYEDYNRRPYWYLPGAWEREINKHY